MSEKKIEIYEREDFFIAKESKKSWSWNITSCMKSQTYIFYLIRCAKNMHLISITSQEMSIKNMILYPILASFF